jgi:hypothetical protein
VSEQTGSSSGLYGARRPDVGSRTTEHGDSSAAYIRRAPPTSDELAGACRALERRLDEQRAEFVAHQAEAHPKLLPNLVGSIQAQWQVIPAPIKQMIMIYGVMVLVALGARFMRWFLASFKPHKEKTQPPILRFLQPPE